MGTFLRSLVSWWPKLPKEVRIMLLVAVAGMLITAGGMIAYLAWRDGYIQDKLGGFFGRKELNQDLSVQLSAQNDTMQAMTDDGTRAIRVFLADTLATIRKNAEDSLLNPMATLFTSIDKRLGALEKNQAALNNKVEDIPEPDNAALYEVVDAIRGQPTNAELMRLIREQNKLLNAQTDSLEQFKKELGRKKGSPIKL